MAAPRETLTPDQQAAADRLLRRIVARGYSGAVEIIPQRDTADQIVGWVYHDPTRLVEYLPPRAQRFALGNRPATATEAACVKALNARALAAGYSGTLTFDPIINSAGTVEGWAFAPGVPITEYVTPRPRVTRAAR